MLSASRNTLFCFHRLTLNPSQSFQRPPFPLQAYTPPQSVPSQTTQIGSLDFTSRKHGVNKFNNVHSSSKNNWRQCFALQANCVHSAVWWKNEANLLTKKRDTKQTVWWHISSVPPCSQRPRRFHPNGFPNGTRAAAATLHRWVFHVSNKSGKRFVQTWKNFRYVNVGPWGMTSSWRANMRRSLWSEVRLVFRLIDAAGGLAFNASGFFKWLNNFFLAVFRKLTLCQILSCAASFKTAWGDTF